jgi:cytochrome b561
MPATAAVSRYHPLLVALHWLLALLIIGNLAGGLLVLDNLADTDPEKQQILRLHMAGGLIVLGLMLVRIVTRFTTARPLPAHAHGPLRWLAAASHGLLYVLILAMAVTGLGTAQLAGLFPILEGKPVTLPTDWSTIAPHAGHELFARVIVAVIGLHLAGWLYHAVRRDGTAARMWFGARRA